MLVSATWLYLKCRRVKLFEFFEQSRASSAGQQGSEIVLRAYSSDLAPSARKEILDKFKSQEIHMCVLHSALSSCRSLTCRGLQPGVLGSHLLRH